MTSANPRQLLALFCLFACLFAAGCQNRGTAARPARPAQAVVEHVVAAGDTLSSVATAYGVSIATIVQANSLRDRTLHPGQRLAIPGGRAAELPPVVIEQPVEKPAPAAWFVPRSEWAREPVVMSRVKPMGGTPVVITVHHSGGKNDAGMDPITWLQEVDHQHMLGIGKAEPWACIGYHFIVAPDGRVFEGRPLAYQGAHAGWDEINRLNIGVCLIGDFDERRVPIAQRDGLLRVLDQLCLDYGISRAHVYGHKHFKVTDCPGRFLTTIVEAYAAGPGEPSAHRLALAAPAAR